MGLPRHIKALLNTGAYPEGAEKVVLHQTHISYLFFTPEFVYKVKKPVDFGFLDFTTLERRKKFCHEEVRLNRRLAPDVYLGVASINEEDGRVRMGGKGIAIEYAVKMRRLKSEAMLDEMIREERITEAVIKRVAEKISLFHKKASTDARISGFGSYDVIKKNIEENFSQTRDFTGRLLTEDLYRRIKTYSEDFLERHKGVFLKRMADGFIRDCHGDIHAEHISIEGAINIIDCIEFNERFRFSDTVSDMAFLSMDLDYLNRADLSKAFDRAYFSSSGDEDGKKLLNFYKCYRAFIRAKVEGFKYLEPEVEGAEKKEAFIGALHHFHLAGQYAAGGFKPQLIITCGLSGTGKSAIARAVRGSTGAVHLSSDAVRKELAGINPDEHRFEEFGAGIYSREFTEKTYGELIRRGVELLKAGRTCILDATFSKARFLDLALLEGRRAGTPRPLIHIIECTAPEELIRGRLLKRLEEAAAPPGGAASDMRGDIFKGQKASYEKKKTARLILDGARPFDENLLKVIKEVFCRGDCS
ncbi:MAG: AAA family ATPase [Thermodesulfobacteriota bacterium]